MKFTFIQPASFATDWRRLKLSDEDLRALENSIIEHPEIGKVMRGTGGLRKMRFAPPSRLTGKSGAMRIGYLLLPELARVYLLIIFPKNEKQNLRAAERGYVKKWIEYLHWQAKQEQQR